MTNEIHIRPEEIARARAKTGLVPSVTLETDALRAARGRIAARRNQALPQPVLTPPQDSLRIANLSARQRKFNEVEPAIFQQHFAGREVEGHKINSCRIASSIIALARMGVIKTEPTLMAQLETEIVRDQLRAYAVLENGNIQVTVPKEIFYDFGLQSGIIASIRKAIAVLRAGGCIVIGLHNHANCITELNSEGTQVKVFDPLVNNSQIKPISLIEEAIKIGRSNIFSTDLIGVYPPGYKPPEHEIRFADQIRNLTVTRTHTLDVTRYKK